MTNQEPTIQVTGEAATINAVTDICGEYAQDNGFRQEWLDAEWLRHLAKLISSENEAEFRLTSEIPERLERIANDLERLANVQKLMLTVSELAEALSDMRNGDDFGEELADVVIRAMDQAHANRYPLGDLIVKKIDQNSRRPYRHGRGF